MNCVLAVTARWLMFLASTFGGIAYGQVNLAVRSTPPGASELPDDANGTASISSAELKTLPPSDRQVGPLVARQKVEKFFGENCAACHGAKKNRVVPGLNILDMDSLVTKGYITPGKSSKSPIVRRLMNGEMPPRPKATHQAAPVLLAAYFDNFQPPDTADVFTVLDADQRLTTVVRLVKASRLVEELQQPGPFTILAPTNEAFDKLPKAQLEALTAEGADSNETRPVLLNHAILWGTALSAEDLAKKGRATSAAFRELKIVRDAGGRLRIENAIVIEEDIRCSNGVIHVIDQVLLLPGPAPNKPRPYFTANGIKMEGIPGGVFQMGTPPPHDWQTRREGPVRSVRISPFYMAAHETTGEQYKGLRGDPAPGKVWPRPLLPNNPVGKVSWSQAALFCNSLSALEGLAKFYQTQIVDGEEIVVGYNLESNGYRLPTEAEWEYACRAGSAAKWCFGNAEAMLRDYAWHSANANGPMPIGRLQPNAFGLYDMHGNVAEWCFDWYAPYAVPVGAAALTDLRGPLVGTTRVYRGGSYLRNASGCRSAARYFNGGAFQHDGLGFRIARTVNAGEPVPLPETAAD